MAMGYWRLPEDAKWVDTLRCICADETHHRDVNHTYANLKDGQINPYLAQHKSNAAIAWRLQEKGES
jgi:ubiquinol oxidase